MQRSLLCLSFLVLLLQPIAGKGQTYLPPDQPEQDACGALNICSFFYQTNKSYFEHGLVEEPMEYHSHWLKVKINQGGNLVFTIKPNRIVDSPVAYDNYDFYVFDGTGKSCSNLGNPIRGNTSSPAVTYNQGRTGLNMASTADFTFNTQFSKYIAAPDASVYYILINNYGHMLPSPFPLYEATMGYSIDFSGSTCTFVKGNAMQMDSVATRCTNYKELILYLSKPVQCSSIDELASDFSIDNGSPFMAQGLGCSSTNPYTSTIRIELAPYLTPGTYTLRGKVGSDGNSLIDMCDDELPLPSHITFVVPDLDSSVQLTLCPSQMPYTWNGLVVNTAGTNIASFVSPSYIGCDSTTRLSITLVDTLKDTTDLSICAAQLPYTWNGITVAAPGQNAATYHTISSGGCDSTTYLNLSLISPVNQTLALSGCGSLVFESNTYTQTTSFNDTLHSSFGCDSVYRTVNITIYPGITPGNIYIDTAGCGYMVFRGVVYNSNTTITDTLYNIHGCDSIYRHYNLIINPNVQPRKAEQTVSGCQAVTFEGNTYSQDTTLRRLFKSQGGCDSLLMTTHIAIRQLELVLTADPVQPVKNDYLVLTTSANEPYTILAWLPQQRFAQQQATEQSLFITEEETYKAVAISAYGCIDTATLTLKPDSLIPVALMPNAFSPNGDGLNDEFKPFFVNKSGYVVKRFQIFDRWGKLVYQAFGTKKAAWNGQYGNNGKDALPGTYYYYLDIEFIDKTKASFKGEVILLK